MSVCVEVSHSYVVILSLPSQQVSQPYETMTNAEKNKRFHKYMMQLRQLYSAVISLNVT